jgi:regulatory protein
LVIEAAAIRLLTVREHSRQELHMKLRKRQYESELIEQVLDDLQASSLQSDARFTESFIGSRVRKGQGPLRIRSELRDRGVDECLVDEYLEAYSDQWQVILQDIHDAKYGSLKPDSSKEMARRARFLESRGFPGELIRGLLLD